jgi:uncharacterized membrane protein YbaN (DUF454 family)
MNIKKAFLIFVGTLSVGLGVLGMFLPLLPTTVFLLLGAYCYSHSSERFHDWLLNNRLCGEYIRNYTSGRGITVRQKVSTLATLWASIGFSTWYVSGALWFNLMMLAIAGGVSLHILRLNTYRPGVEELGKEARRSAAENV